MTEPTAREIVGRQVSWWLDNIQRTQDFLSQESDEGSKEVYRSGISQMELHLSVWKALEAVLQIIDDVNNDIQHYPLNAILSAINEALGVSND